MEPVLVVSASNFFYNPKYGWFADEIANGKLLYINKKRSTHWLAGLGHLKPSSGHASLHASIMNIINNPPQNIKTENDLKDYRYTHNWVLIL